MGGAANLAQDGNQALSSAKSLREHFGVRDALMAISQPQRMSIKPPKIVTLVADTKTLVSNFVDLSGNRIKVKRVIINVGTTQVYVTLTNDQAQSLCNKDNYHFPLAPASAVNNGNGGAVDISQWPADALAFSEGGAGRISIVEAEAA